MKINLKMTGHWAMYRPRLAELVSRFNTQTVQEFEGLRVQGLKARADSRGIDPAAEPVGPENDLYAVSNGVACIPIVGVMTDHAEWFDDYMGLVAADTVVNAILAAEADPAVTSVAFEIDSPGGYAPAGGTVARAVASMRKPSVAWVSGMCASAAYRAASQADRIVAAPDALVGSIGTYVVLADTTGMQEQIGLKLTVVSSGEYKGLGADGTVDDKLLADEQRLIGEINELFLADVKHGRGLTDARTRELADGRVWIAASAMDLGLIDAVNNGQGARGAAGAADFLATGETPVVRKRNASMTLDQFKAFAAENPGAVSAFTEQGKNAGKAEALASEKLRAVAVRKACGTRSELALDLIVAGKDENDAVVAVAALDRDAAASSAKTAELQAEITRLKAEVALKPTSAAIKTGAQSGEDADPAGEPDADEDPKAAAGWEWDNKKEVRKGFRNKDNYVAFRAAELAGNHRNFNK